MAAAAYSNTALPHRNATHQAPATVSNAPQGTFLPGTKVQVGSHRVIIEKYLSEGGFAHVYVVRVPRDGNKYELAVLKRVAVPDKDHLASMRTEVETMKKLKGHRYIVTYFDSHANQLKGGGYEVFLLMEYCQGGGLIDFMNTRLQHRLIEPEILKIFGDVAEGVACMHYLKPPLLHRDLKVENVLIAKNTKDGVPMYKLCDFGSTAPPRPAATTAEEGRLIEDDVQKHTTMQYRSPEMIDVWRKRPIDEKADIWALGVLLYKLCYYTTPFEEVGRMAILNASFKYPALPQFSPRLRKLIGTMLKEDPLHRPNIYQVIEEVCSMRGTEVPIKDIYSGRTQSESRRNESLPTADSSPAIGLQRATPSREVGSIPDIAPMRRGRPTASSSQQTSKKPSPSPAKGDPFAALDSKNYEVRAGAVEDLSKRFPTLDDFSISQEKSGQFEFGTSAAGKPGKVDLAARVTNAHADDAFSNLRPSDTKLPSSGSRTPVTLVASKPQAVPNRSVSTGGYKSTGVGSSPPPVVKSSRFLSSSKPDSKLPEPSGRAIWRVPSAKKESVDQPRASPKAEPDAAYLQPGPPPVQGPALLDIHRSKSQTSTVSMYSDNLDSEIDPSLLRAKTMQNRSRPSSVYVASNLDFLRDQESARKPSTDYKKSLESRRGSRQHSPRLVATDDGESAVLDIENDVDFLQSKEGEDAKQPKHSRKSSSGFSLGHRKRSSLPGITGAAKDVFKGAFSSAFNRFEAGGGKNDGPRTPSAEQEQSEYRDSEGPEAGLLSPIAGSEATPSKHSDEADEVEDVPLEMRREMERRRLSAEERRVADAARLYKEQTAAGLEPQSSRGLAIQQRVQSLLEEGARPSSPVKRTAEGYGKYTDSTSDAERSSSPMPPRTSSLVGTTTQVIRPVNTLPIQHKQESSMASHSRARAMQAAGSPDIVPEQYSRTPPSLSSSPHLTQLGGARPGSRPSAPPKPNVLRTAQWPPSPLLSSNVAAVDKPLPPQPSGNLAALLARDLEGVPDYPSRDGGAPTLRVQKKPQQQQSRLEDDDDVEEEFGRRYPSLSGIELVETDVRVREI